MVEEQQRTEAHMTYFVHSLVLYFIWQSAFLQYVANVWIKWPHFLCLSVLSVSLHRGFIMKYDQMLRCPVTDFFSLARSALCSLTSLQKYSACILCWAVARLVEPRALSRAATDVVAGTVCRHAQWLIDWTILQLLILGQQLVQTYCNIKFKCTRNIR